MNASSPQTPIGNIAFTHLHSGKNLNKMCTVPAVLSKEHDFNLVSRTPILSIGTVEEKREEVLRYFQDTFTLYESLFECLASEQAFYVQPNRLRHPLIFYYGHTSVFFINKLNASKLIDKCIDPEIESSLAIGVDEMSWDDLDLNSYSWPTPTEVKAHRDKTRGVIEKFIRECDFTMPITWDSPMWIVLMGIEHERIHLETSSVLIRELSLEFVNDHPIWGRICRESGPAPVNELIKVDGGHVKLGRPRVDNIYRWDNEYGSFETDVESFRASKYLVSNQEFLEFVRSDGYAKEEFWTDEGWKWVQFQKAKHPVFWIPNGDTWRYRTMLQEIDLPWDWPVEVNYLESKAFCNWKSRMTDSHIRLPSKAEWNCLRQLVDTDQPYWTSAPGNINLEGDMSSCHVNVHEFEKGFFDIIGNVWQWTDSVMDAFDRFQVHPIYDDFSTATFDGKHQLFKGGCWISTGNYAVKDSRYAFRRHFFQHSGFRYVRAELIREASFNIYETNEAVSMYIEFHWGDSYLNVPNFPVACVKILAKHLQGRETRRALDIGCATARSAFEMATLFDHVDAVDFSARLITMPTRLQQVGKQRYMIQDEGELYSIREVLLENYDGYVESKDKICLSQGDACNLREKYNAYDAVFAGNLLCRLYDPAAFLNLIKGRIEKGGLLLIASPYTLMEEHTPREKWLGGFKRDNGENKLMLDGIRDELEPEFSLLERVDVPFVLRETRRKFQHTISDISVWEKISGDCN